MTNYIITDELTGEILYSFTAESTFEALSELDMYTYCHGLTVYDVSMSELPAEWADELDNLEGAALHEAAFLSEL